MGEIAQRIAHVCYRDERQPAFRGPAEDHRGHSLRDGPEASGLVVEIDRREAIARAVSMARVRGTSSRSAARGTRITRSSGPNGTISTTGEEARKALEQWRARLMETTLSWVRDGSRDRGSSRRVESRRPRRRIVVRRGDRHAVGVRQPDLLRASGDKTDGHRFVDEAHDEGLPRGCGPGRGNRGAASRARASRFSASAARSRRSRSSSARYLRSLDMRVVAVTGSMGKTTTKEYIRGDSQERNTTSTTNSGNLNNHIGVPLTVLDTDRDNEYLVCEIAANHTGEIDFLSRLLRPDIGVITNIGEAHIGYFGSRDKIAEAKSEIFAGVDPEGYAVLPADDGYSRDAPVEGGLPRGDLRARGLGDVPDLRRHRGRGAVPLRDQRTGDGAGHRRRLQRAERGGGVRGRRAVRGRARTDPRRSQRPRRSPAARRSTGEKGSSSSTTRTTPTPPA